MGYRVEGVRSTLDTPTTLHRLTTFMVRRGTITGRPAARRVATLPTRDAICRPTRHRQSTIYVFLSICCCRCRFSRKRMRRRWPRCARLANADVCFVGLARNCDLPLAHNLGRLLRLAEGCRSWRLHIETNDNRTAPTGARGLLPRLPAGDVHQPAARPAAVLGQICRASHDRPGRVPHGLPSGGCERTLPNATTWWQLTGTPGRLAP
jgi:hypothetical protein